MNKNLKLLLNNKKLLIGSGFVLAFIILLAFFPFGKRANSSIEGENINSESQENLNDAILSSYETTNDGTILLYKGSDSKFSFVNQENNVLFTTTDNVNYFRVLSDTAIVYLSSHLNTSTNKLVRDVKLVDLQSNSITDLHTGENIHMDVANGYIYVVNGTNGDVLVGTSSLKKAYSLNNTISKVVSNKGKLFAINNFVFNNTVYSNLYLLNPNSFDFVNKCEGKIQSVTVDYNNDNLIYYSSEALGEYNTTDGVTVYKQYLVNLSASSDGLETYSNLNYNVISLKNGYISVDVNKNSIILLNNNFTVSKTLDSISSSMPLSLLNETPDGESIYYFNSLGKLVRL